MDGGHREGCAARRALSSSAARGLLLATTLSGLGVGLALAGLIMISLYGEFRSISTAVERVPLLQRLDSLGRVN